MDDAALVRATARGAIDDITPSPLRKLLDTRLQNSGMTPGVLTRLSAQATNENYDIEELDQHAAGVQLIYDGLDFTRTVSRSPPWEDDGGESDQGDIDLLAANVLVARGFSILTHTEATRKAVETVQEFGQYETNHAVSQPDPELGERTLEANVFEMAIIAGTSAAGVTPPSKSAEFAADMARSFDCGRLAGSELRSEPVVETLTGLVVDGEYQPAAPLDVWTS